MTSVAVVFLLVSGVAAAADWWAVGTSNRGVEYVAKPVTLAALVGVALALDPANDAMRAWFVVALVCSLAGDVFLMLPRDLFLPGLGSFLLGHLAYIAGFVVADPERVALLVTAPVAGIALFLYARYLIVNMKPEQRVLRVPVALYAVAIGTMLAFALASGSVIAAIGALLFVTSDGLIGYSRFVRMPAWAPVAIIVTYHLGQAGLVLSLISPT